MPIPRLPPEARAIPRELAAARCFLRPRTFTGLEVAASIARTIGVLVHCLWLASELAESPGDDDDLAAESGWLWQILRRNLRPGTCQATTAGSDVLVLFGGESLAWNRERTGRTGARQLGIDEIDGVLPDAAAAAALADLLNQDELGSPVVWHPWWRSVHAY